MTTQEQQLIDGLVQRVNGTSLSDKDPEAENRLQQGLGANPNALYVLAQTVLVQQYALDQAKQQIAGARAELDSLRQQTATPPQKHTGFLESIFGSHDAPAPPPSGSAPPPLAAGYAPVQNYAPPPQAQPTYPASSLGGAPMGGGGGFLRGAVQTAAGVAAGALAFQGVESLLHGFGGGQGFGGSQGLSGFGAEQGRPEEIINNNYYGDQDRSTGSDDDRGDTDNNPGDNLFTDSGSNQSGDTVDSDDSQTFDSGSDMQDDPSDSGSFGDDSSFGDDGGSDLGGDNSAF